jgi:hypothetical protein
MVSRARVLEGSLLDFDLQSVLTVVSTSRQLTGVELRDELGVVIGTLFVKADDIVAARSGVHSGQEAVRRLLSVERPAHFLAFRVSDCGELKSLVAVADAFASFVPQLGARRVSTIVATMGDDEPLAAEDSDTDEELLVFAEIAEPRQPRRSK